MSRRSGRRGASAPAFPALSTGVQNGLRRLVEDNADTVAKMLDADKGSSTEVLCEKCAQVMKQQQLSAASFLARFFQSAILSEHAVLCGKSGKGSEATLGDRIEAAWAKNKPFPEKEEAAGEGDANGEKKEKEKDIGVEDGQDKEEDEEDAKRKRKEESGKEGDSTEKIPKKTKKSLKD